MECFYKRLFLNFFLDTVATDFTERIFKKFSFSVCSGKSAYKRISFQT